MSIETRSSSALFKRAEQLKRWEESDTNREPVSPKHKSRKIKFSSGCVFLAACAAGEKEEVLNLLEKGADIDTANVDGLTALHQACIDDNLDMVEFLVEHGSDVNRGDNEGWTPLHATVSCGFVSIAKYLLEHSANVAAVNCDGELALDIAESPAMEELIQTEIDERGIDCEEARNEEKRIMLRDAREWLTTKSPSVDIPSPKTGATPLHVASAKGYIDVIKVLMQCGSDVDKQDIDGWTPLHAAAHWGQKDAAQMLTDNFSDMDAKNYVGQTAFDVADGDMKWYLEELKKKQNKEEVLNRRQAKKKLEGQDNHMDIETPIKVKKVELEIQQEDKIVADSIGMEVSSESETESSDDSSETESSETGSDEKKNRVNANMDSMSSTVSTPATMTSTVVISSKDEESVKGPPSTPPKPHSPVDSNSDDNKPSWRRPIPGRQPRPETPIKSSNSFKNKDTTNENEVVLRRTNSFQNDPAFYARYRALRARIQATSFPTFIIPPHPHQRLLSSSKEDNAESMESTTTSTTTSTTNSPTKHTGSPASSPLPNSQPVRRSFVPPVRDEESETQRKAHAKRVRETRRSTQGVTLEEIKSAEQLVKQKNKTVNNNNNEQPPPPPAALCAANGVSVSATITTATPTVVLPSPPREPPIEEASTPPATTQERRPSWRLRVDNGSKFKLEDANKVAEPPTTQSFVRRAAATNPTTAPRPSSAPVETADTTVTLPLRRPKSIDEKEQDKENDVRNAQATLATQAAIQRRRRPKRRSTGVVAFDNMEDIDPEKDNSGGGDCEETTIKLNHQESGNERASSRRIGSSNDLIRGENGEIDYKKLYEAAIVDNDVMKDKLRKRDEELRDTKQTLEKLNTVTSKNSLSELEKRERRAMERKLSEMEEELKQLQKLKAENERLRAENRALTRVVSKLSNSAAK